jgi:hypothetical protein
MDKSHGAHLMTERTVTVRLGIQDEIGNLLLAIRTQRDALLSKSIVDLRVKAEGLKQARKASAQAQAESAVAIKDLEHWAEMSPLKQLHPWPNTRNCSQCLKPAVSWPAELFCPILSNCLILVQADVQWPSNQIAAFIDQIEAGFANKESPAAIAKRLDIPEKAKAIAPLQNRRWTSNTW